MTTFLAQNAFLSNSVQSDTCAEAAVAPKSQPPFPDAMAVLIQSSDDDPLDQGAKSVLQAGYAGAAGSSPEASAAADCIAELLGYASDKPSRFVLDEDALFEAIEPLPLFLRDAG